MARLVETTPFGALLPRQVGAVTLSEVATGPVFSVAPFRTGGDAAGTALATIGLHMPGPGATVAADGGARAFWIGPGRALVFGPVPEGLAEAAAVTDQTGAQAVLRIEGATAEAVLARLVPLDLRPDTLAEGRTARTLLGHMTVSITRVGPTAFGVMAMRSMAGTLVDEVAEAAERVAARARAV